MKLRLTFVAMLFMLFTLPTAFAQVAGPENQELQSEDEWIRMKAEQGDSHASGMRPELGPVILGNPTQTVAVIRVGLYYSYTATGAFSEYASLHHPFVDISNTAGDVHVLDRATGKQIMAITPGMIVHVSYDGTGYQVSADNVPLGTFQGPIFFKPTEAANRFRVESIRRTFGTTQVPLYRGAIEVARSTATQANKVNVVNVVEVEDYVPGVVVNESIASFHIEALKAQAVAARGYAISNVGRYVKLGYPFDIVDSSSSQVYRGVISEHAKAVQASAETAGLVGSYNGKIIEALYSSSFGGHSENNEWIYNSPNTQWPGTNATAYLRGIYDGEATKPDFSSDEGIAAFWTVSRPDIYDDCVRVGNRFSRWRIVLKAADIKARLTGTRYVLISGNISGDITDVELATRMTGSSRIAIARIKLTTGEVEVRGWDNLRNVLGKSAVSTPAMCAATAIAANFVLNNPTVIQSTKNLDGTLKELTAWGGGWGHNLGFSQYGANGRAKAGQNFLQILKAYYTGIDVGAYPIDIGREPGSGPPTLRQQFYAPNGRGILVVRARDMKGLRVHINETGDLSFDQAQLADGVVSVDISSHMQQGLNTVQYNPVGRDGKATVAVVVD